MKNVISMLLALVLSACLLAVPTLASTPAPLTKDDFSFGGKTYQGYTNFVDLVEAKGGTPHYYFDDDTPEARKANRGVKIWSDLYRKPGDISIGDWENYNTNPIFTAYGKTNQIPVEREDLPDYVPNAQGGFAKLVYPFSYRGRTYYKIFWLGHGCGECDVIGIEYTVK